MDLKTELQNFKPVDLEEYLQAKGKVPDNIRNSIFLYNKAMESLRSGSEDIAVIELRKAVSMNPGFYRALNLLGVCYAYAGETEKAAETFEKVVKAESNSIVAMNYMKRFGIGDFVSAAQNEKQTKKGAEFSLQPLKRIRTKKTGKSAYQKQRQLLHGTLKIGAGFAAGLLLSFIFFSYKAKPEPVPPAPDQNETDTVINEMKAEYEKKYAELQSKYESLQKDKEKAVSQVDYYKTALRLYDIESLAKEGKYENAADILLLLRTVEFDDAEKEKIDSLYKTIMPKAAKSAYDQAFKFYNTKKYQDALKSFEKVQLYDPSYKQSDAVLYYMGRSCQLLQDSRGAVAYYQRLVDNYPASAYIKSAKVRINELTKIP